MNAHICDIVARRRYRAIISSRADGINNNNNSVFTARTMTGLFSLAGKILLLEDEKGQRWRYLDVW